MTPERYKRLHDVLSQRQTDLTVVADEVHKGRNIAAILRTCDSVGVDKMYSVQPEEGYWPYRGTALGSQKWVEVELCASLKLPLERLKSQRYQLVTTALSKEAVDFREVDYTLPTALILGSEDDGVSHYAKSMADQLVTIPMMGMVESFNVSVACAVILLEAQRQRMQAGMYQQVSLPPEHYEKRFFEWAHPSITNYCKKKAIAYPELGVDGEIIDPAAWYKRVREKVRES